MIQTERASRLHDLFNQLVGFLRRDRTDLSALAQATTAAMIVTNEFGKIAHVSPGFTTLTGFTAKDVVGQTPAMALHGQDTDHGTVELLRNRCQATQPFGVNILLYAQGNRPMWVTSQGRPIIRGGRFLGYVITQTAIAAQPAQPKVREAPVRAHAA
jgi:methyl-accepting chemotaxis protein